MRVDGRLLLAGLATPARLRDLSGTAWAAMLGLARRERVLGILAQRVIGGGHIVPHPVRLALEDGRSGEIVVSKIELSSNGPARVYFTGSGALS